MKVYGQDIKWVDGVTNDGEFPMTEQEWNALFKKTRGWATLSVIQLAATMMNCRIFTYTPVNPVARDDPVAPDATWIWKDVKPIPRFTACPKCPGAIFLFNERANHY